MSNTVPSTVEYVLVNRHNQIVRSFGANKQSGLDFMAKDEWKRSTIRLMEKTIIFKEVPTNE